MEEITQEVIYPVIETSVVFPLEHGAKEFFLPDCCFQDFFEENTTMGELAGMGLAIVGNVIKFVQSGKIPIGSYFNLVLKLSKDSDPIPLPWPGMKNANPRLLHGGKYFLPEELPFDFTMFIDDEGNVKKRIDRLELLRRIEDVWAPYFVNLVSLRV